MSHERELNELERAIKELRIEFERFFNGALETPPEPLREQIHRRLRALRNTNLQSAVETFRLNSLEARFNSFNDMYGRRLRDLEEGRAQTGAGAQPRPRHDPERGVVFGERPESEAVKALYEGLSRGAGKGPRFDLDSFERYLERQVTSIRKKTGCSRVQFRLAREGDKMKLKAKPVKE